MEEVWEDITLTSLNPNPNGHFQTLTFQDFFSNQNPNPNQIAAASADIYPSLASPLPVTLSLNSDPNRFNSVCHSDQFRQNSLPFTTPQCMNNMSFDELASGPGLPELGRKRFPEGENSGDQRHKRMLKNRESAARSRARKQAYTNELELEVAHLMEENARLKGQQQQLRVAAASQIPKRHAHHRASTAPF